MIWLYESDHDAEMEAGISPDEESPGARSGRHRAGTLSGDFPGLDHTDHHRILRRFLWSDWTRDKARLQRAADAYRGSIGKWKRDVDDDETVQAFYAFREAEIEAMAEEFLRENGIEPVWRTYD